MTGWGDQARRSLRKVTTMAARLKIPLEVEINNLTRGLG
jgi:hypothetical protein